MNCFLKNNYTWSRKNATVSNPIASMLVSLPPDKAQHLMPLDRLG